MFKSRLFLTANIIATLLVLGFWVVQARADFLIIVEPEEEVEIKQTIEAYFEARYRAHDTLQVEGITELIDTSPQSDDFRRSEMDKLEIEFYHAKLNNLRYVEYKFFLEFKDISVGKFSQTATVSVVEGHDVVFENSSPLVSSMRNLEHTIVLHKANGAWMIISDYYDDYIWRMLRATNQSMEEVLHSIDEAQRLASSLKGEQIDETSCSLPPDQSSHPYSRYSAIEYAHRWATSPRPYNSPPYYDFTDEGGDCTNFVS